MTIFLRFLSIIGLLFFMSCEDFNNEDTTPPTVSISSSVSGQGGVNGIVTIVVSTQDNNGISWVEFFVNDSLVFTDSELPYEYLWNTTQFENNFQHFIKVLSYDNSNNYTESQPILIIVEDNPPITPIINSTYFTGNGINLDWVQSQDNDFYNYSIEYSDTNSFDTYEKLYRSNNQSIDNYFYDCDTNYYVSDFANSVPAYYRLITTDLRGQESISNISTIEFEYPNLTISAPDTIQRPPGSTIILERISTEIIHSFDNETISFIGFRSYHVEGDTMMNNGNYIYLYDDGSEVILNQPDFTSGDLIQGDGIFSFNVPVFGTGSNQTIPGTYIWYFTIQYHCLVIEPFIHHLVVE